MVPTPHCWHCAKWMAACPSKPSSAMLLTELTKLLLCAFSLLADWQAWPQGAPPWRQAAPFALSALLYGANNNLVIYLQCHVDPSTYQVLSNLEIGITALFYCLCLQHRLSACQGLALMLLMAAGARCAAGGLQDPGHTLPGPPPAAAAGRMALRLTPRGPLLLILCCLISGLPSVYTELLMKRQRLPPAPEPLPLHMRCASAPRPARWRRPWPRPPGGLLRLGTRGAEPGPERAARVHCPEARRQHHPPLRRVLLARGERCALGSPAAAAAHSHLFPGRAAHRPGCAPVLWQPPAPNHLHPDA
ncbi:putative UDP-sugar transporter protein SLC35A4 [Manis javanica]|nr:putative UDP-sugar transporter protein SLC35A4 [Manis javanica]